MSIDKWLGMATLQGNQLNLCLLTIHITTAHDLLTLTYNTTRLTLLSE